MSRLAKAVVTAIRGTLNHDNELLELDENSFCNLIFQNHRENAVFGHGVRLTWYGLSLMQDRYESFEVALTKDRLSTKDILYLDRRLNFPYFIGNGKIILFDQTFAVILKLRDGSIRDMREADMI